MALRVRKNWLWLIPVLLLVVVCSLAAVKIVGSMDYHHQDNDFFTFWLAGHLVAQGQSPYDAGAWVEGYAQNQMQVVPNQAFLYPLPLALLLAPLGWLPFETAYITWVTLLELMIIGSLAILLTIIPAPRARYLFIPMLVGIILFRPTILTLTQGQVSGTFLLVLVLLALAWKREKWFLGGLLLGLLVLKPNLGLIVIALPGVWLLVHRRWSAIAGVAVSGVILLVVGLAYRVDWLGQYWQIGNNKLAQTFGGSPTVWGSSALICRNHMSCTLSLGGSAAAVLVIGFLWLILRNKKLSPAAILGLALLVTMLVAPYTWTYDQLLLILPVTLMVLKLDGMGVKMLLTGMIFPVIDIVAVILLIFDVQLQVEILNALIPLMLLGPTVWVLTHPEQSIS